MYRNGETVWELEPGFLRIRLLLGCFCLGKMKCVICQIEQAWCFPQRLNKLAVERNGSGGGGGAGGRAVYLSCYITVLFEEFPNIYIYVFFLLGSRFRHPSSFMVA